MLQRRGLEEVAAGVKALVKARGLEEVKSIDLDSRSRGRQSSLEASRKTETTIDTRRMAVARREALERVLETRERTDADRHGTVGAVAIDQNGNLAAATTTGGMTAKMHGRIGDAPGQLTW